MLKKAKSFPLTSRQYRITQQDNRCTAMKNGLMVTTIFLMLVLCLGKRM